MMSSQRRKLYYSIGCILLVILFCLTGGIGTIKWYKQVTGCYDRRSPLRSLEVKIDVTQQQQLIEQFNKFADKNGYKLHVSYYTPNHQQFLIDLKRKDTEVTASSPFAQGEFKVGFYNNNCTHPTVAADIENLVSDLNNLLSEIPNATITEEK